MPTQRKPTRLLALLMLSPLAGCATGTAATDSGCKSFAPIRWSKQDTEPTQREVMKHNRRYDAICKN